MKFILSPSQTAWGLIVWENWLVLLNYPSNLLMKKGTLPHLSILLKRWKVLSILLLEMRINPKAEYLTENLIT